MSFRFADGWTVHPAAVSADLVSLLAKWQDRAPDELVTLLRQTNGASFDWITLWPAAEIANDNYRATEFGPHLLFFGSNSSGELFAFDRRPAPAEIVMVHSISNWEEDTFHVARNLQHLIERIELVMADESGNSSLLAPWK